MGKMRTTAAGLLLGSGMILSAICGTAAAEAPRVNVDAGGSDTDIAAAEALAIRQAAVLDRERLGRVAINGAITLEGLPLTEAEVVDLELTRMKIFSDDAVFLLDNEPQPLPDIASFRGRIAGDPDTYAFVTVGDMGMNGYVKLADGTIYSISTGKTVDEAGNARVWQATDLRITDSTFIEGNPLGVDTCGAVIFPQDIEQIDPADVQARGNDSMMLGAACRVAEVALDSDWEFSSEEFGGNGNAAANYATSLISAVSEIFVREVNTRLEISFLRTWSSNSDPYGPGQGDVANQLQNHWRSSQGSVQRDIVHMLTGQNPSYGGVALGLGILCNNSFGYSVSAYLNGFFPYPLANYRNSNWDPVVVAHELGHCFNAPHTHDYNPPIDRCGIDCAGNRVSTIMSYCHTCSGGMTNIALEFHPTNRTRMQNYVNSAFCLDLDNSGAGTADNDAASTFTAIPVTVDVLENDSGGNCSATAIDTFDATSAQGGQIILQPAGGSLGVPGRESLRYTPPAGFNGVDTFSYTVAGGDQGTVTITVDALRAADAPTPDANGLKADYYLLFNNPTSVDAMASLTPFMSDIAPAMEFDPTNGAFGTTGVSDYVGAIFEGSFRAFLPGAYTFTLTSDDGSRLYIGDELVVDNDGTHGAETVSGTIGLGQGQHSIRIEYFERTGSSTLVATYSTSFNSSDTVLEGSLIGHTTGPVNCNAADIAEPFGELNIDDVLSFLDAFADGDAAADIAAPTGVLNIDDVLDFLDAFATGCP